MFQKQILEILSEDNQYSFRKAMKQIEVSSRSKRVILETKRIWNANKTWISKERLLESRNIQRITINLKDFEWEETYKCNQHIFTYI